MWQLDFVYKVKNEGNWQELLDFSLIFLKRESLRLISIGKLLRKIFSFTKVKLMSLHISFLRIKIIIKFYVLLLILIIFYFKNTLLAARRQNNSEATLIWIKKSRQKIQREYCKDNIIKINYNLDIFSVKIEWIYENLIMVLCGYFFEKGVGERSLRISGEFDM